MKFEMSGFFEKCVWSSEKSSLWIFQERKEQNHEWAVFTSEKPTTMKLYDIAGYVNKQKSKKYKDDKGYFGNEFSFTVTSLSRADGVHTNMSDGFDDLDHHL